MCSTSRWTSACPGLRRLRTVGAAVVRQQVGDIHRDRERLDLEGFAAIYALGSTNQVEHVIVEIKKGPVARALSS